MDANFRADRKRQREGTQSDHRSYIAIEEISDELNQLNENMTLMRATLEKVAVALIKANTKIP